VPRRALGRGGTGRAPATPRRTAGPQAVCERRRRRHAKAGTYYARANAHTRGGAHSAASIRSNLLRKQLRLPHTARTARSTHLASYSFAAAALLRRAHTSSPEGTASSQGSGSFSPPTPSLHVSTGTQPKTRSAFATCHGAGN
jgi:hypothetical protein